MNPNYYNWLSKEYDSLYIKNINAYQKSKIANSSTDDYFVDFYPSLGIKETQQTDLLIYGQAVNGWNSGFNLSEVYEQNKLEASVFASNKYHYEQNHSPLDWVNARWSKSIFEDFCEDELSQEFYKGTYFAYRSFFWNVAFKLVSDYYGFERSSWNWSKNLAWSNLYKIAPEDANPNLNERKLQEPGSINLVRKEIEEVNPKFCIVLTNLEWWLPFQVGLRTTNLISDDIPDNIVSIEKYNNTNIIVTSRPRFANSDNFTAKILQIINSLK